jgi:O-acetyl-ADP-ribose deacetylase (regulator of RNase III)
MITEAVVNGTTIRLVHGNIVEIPADAIVNAANRGLSGGGGVDGAIHRAGGPSIMAECRRIGGCATGGAVITGAGNLPARHVIHAVAPVYIDGVSGEAEELHGAYAASLRLADQHALSSISFPALGTGAYRYPKREAAEIALGTVIAHARGVTTLREVTFVLFSNDDMIAHARILERLLEIQ